MKLVMVAQADAKGQTQHLAHEQSQCTETSSQDINGISNLQTSDTQLASCEHLTSVTTYPPHALIPLYCLHLGRTLQSQPAVLRAPEVCDGRVCTSQSSKRRKVAAAMIRN